MLRSRDRKTLVGFVAMLSFLVGCSGNEVANLADPAGDLGTLDPPQFVNLTNSATELLGSGTEADAQTAQDVADSVSALVAGGSLEVLTMPGSIDGGQILGTSSSPARLQNRIIASARMASEAPVEGEIASDASIGGGDDDDDGGESTASSPPSEGGSTGSEGGGDNGGDAGPAVTSVTESEEGSGGGNGSSGSTGSGDDETDVGGFGSIFASASNENENNGSSGSTGSEGGPSNPEVIVTMAGDDDDDDDNGGGNDGPEFTEADGKVTLTGENGLSLTFDPATLTRNENDRPTALNLSSPLHVTGTLPTDVQHRNVDLTIQGISGRIAFPENRRDDVTPEIDVNSAIMVSGHVGGISGEIALGGILAGQINEGDDIPPMLAGPALELVVTRLVIPDRIATLGLTARVANLQIPTGDDGGPPTWDSLTGTLDLWAEPGLSSVIEGGVQRIQGWIESDRPIVHSGTYDGPDSGRVTVELSRTNRRVDRLEVTFDQGKPSVSGRVINASGEEETVVTDGSTVRVEGKARFQNGRTSTHSVTMDRENPGSLTFSATIKDAEGLVVLEITGQLVAGGTIQGTWTRPQDATSGTFHSTEEGKIIVESAINGQVARATPPANWNRNLDRVTREND